MDLLVLLAGRPGEVVTREEIFAALWPDTIVGEDTLARCVSKLRRGLGDDPKAPRYVETISKRGYRLIAPVELAPSKAGPSPKPWLIAACAALVLAAMFAIASLVRGQDGSAALLARAQDAYFQYTRTDNETAIALYERVLRDHPDNAAAQAGLARALVQRVVRWPNPPGETDFTRTTLGEALAAGRTRTPAARAILVRARDLALSAARLAPADATVQQALGLTLSALGDFDGAEAAYRRALDRDADAWGALINLGDIQDIRGAPERALPYYERAYEAMQRTYSREPQRIRPWHAEVGLLIAERHLSEGRTQKAEDWYRRVLVQSPLHAGAVTGLAQLLHARGDRAGSRNLCLALADSTGASAGCSAILGR